LPETRQFSAFRRDLYEQLLADQAADLRRDIAKLRGGGKQAALVAASLRERLRRVQTLSALQASDALVVRTATNADVVQPQPVRTIGLLRSMPARDVRCGFISDSCRVISGRVAEE